MQSTKRFPKKEKLISEHNKKFSLPTEGVLGIILITLFIIISIATDKFFTISNLTNLARQTAIIGIISVGMTFVVISAGIDLSVGSIVGFSGIIVSILMKNGTSIFLSIIVALAAGTFIGLVNGFIIYDMKVTPFIATLGMLTIIRGFVMLITNARMISPLPKAFNEFAIKSLFGIPSLSLVWFLVAILAVILTKYTRLGRNIFAIGSNPEAARLSGINTRITIYLVYIICAFLASLAGILVASRLSNGTPQAGNGYELEAIAAVVVGGGSLFGGEGTILGTVLGALIITTIGNGGNLLGINPYILKITIGFLTIFAVYTDQLFKRKLIG